MKKLLLLLPLLFAIPAHAQNSCPGTTYLGAGQGMHITEPNHVPVAWTNLNVTFPSGHGSAYLGGVDALWNVDDDLLYFVTSNPSTWQGNDYARYGTVSYNDGTVSYSGPARFWWVLVHATTPICTEDQIPHYGMISRLKIQSCTSTTHVLTDRFLAIDADGTYCESTTNNPCDSNYFAFNYLDLVVTGPGGGE